MWVPIVSFAPGKARAQIPAKGDRVRLTGVGEDVDGELLACDGYRPPDAPGEYDVVTFTVRLGTGEPVTRAYDVTPDALAGVFVWDAREDA